MNKKLYVGNLGYNVTKNDLEEMFAAHGTVISAQVITDRESGRSKGFGFVEMSSEQDAQAAIAGLNGKNVDGRDLTVNEARPQESRSGGGGGYGGGRSGGNRSGGGGFGRGGGYRTGRKLGAADLRLLILALLAERPSHGYELIKALEERSGGFYSPSPGMIYPALTYLEEIG